LGFGADIRTPFARFAPSPIVRRVRPSPQSLLAAALACLAALALTGLTAYHWPVARVRDAATLAGFVELNRPRVTGLLDWVAHLADPLPYGLLGLALAGLALARRRARAALAIVTILVGSGVTTEALKQLLAHPRFEEWLGAGQIAAASWPSGHATASMALGLCAVLASPRRLRPLAAAVGGAFAIAVSYAILALAWHFPSDVLGGFLVAATWTLAALAALRAFEERAPGRARSEAPARGFEWLAPLALGAGAAAAAIVAAAARPRAASAFALDHPTFIVGAGAIAVLAVGLAAGLARAVR
jgi:membrane-associated phospholipid phosphatase